MPISVQTPIIEHVPNGVTTVFAYPFAILDAEDLKAQLDGAPFTAFTVSGVGSRTGGSITCTSAPTGSSLILYREISLARATDYQELGDLLAETLDDDFDRVWMAVQDLGATSERSMRVPVGETLPILPEASSRAERVLGFDSNGDPIMVTRTEDGGAALGLDLASSAGASLIGFLQSGVGARASTVQDKLRESVSAFDFMTAAQIADVQSGAATLDVTAAIQSAIDAKGEVWLPGDGVFKITAPLTVGFGQKLRGANARIVQHTANTPIIAVSSSKWEVSGLRLEYATQQGVADTAAMGVTFNGAFEGEFANCTISKAFKGFGVSLATSFAYECTFRNIRVIDAYDYGVAFDVNGSIGLTTNTFDNIYVLQTSVGAASPASKGFLIQYHTGGLVMRNCAADKLAGGVLLFIKGSSGVVVDTFYGEANTMKSGSGLLSIDSCADVNIRGYLPWTNTGILGAGQTASFVRITGSSRGINISGRENGTDVTGNLGTIYGIDCNSSNTAIRVNAREFVSDSGFARLDALITGSYYQVWSYSGQVLQDEVLTRKIQYRSAAPTTGTWAQGDTVVNSSPSTSSPVDKWRCIVAGTPGTWRPFGNTVLRGASASRPALGASDLGVMFMDNTLDADGKPIWWNGTAWVDATGATV